MSSSRTAMILLLAAFSVAVGVAAMMRTRPKPPNATLTLRPEAVTEAGPDAYPLHRALRGGMADLSSVLEGADPNLVDDEGRTPLMLACEKRLATAARQLLDAGARPNRMNGEHTTALLFAASNGDEEMVRLLLDRGAYPFVANGAGVTALHAAALGGDARVVRRLLDAGARADAQDSDGLAPLHLAARGGRSELVALLAAKGADLELRDRERSATPLHLAALAGQLEAVAKLVEVGADVNALDAQGRTPLDYAEDEAQPHPEVAALLVAKGAKRAGEASPP